jgi:DNA-binding NarL/FixJ family response regulator
VHTVALVEERRPEGAADAVRVAAARGPVLVVCPADRPALLRAALHAGAVGAVTPGAEPAELSLAATAISRGGYFVSPALADVVRDMLRMPDVPDPGEAPALAPREIETLTLLAQGLTHRQVARRMRLTEQTVNTYVKRLRAKLCAANKAELTRKCIELGYLPAHP